jgi:hypothetical protein
MKLASLYVDKTHCKISYENKVYKMGGAVPILELLSRLFDEKDCSFYLHSDQTYFIADFFVAQTEDAFLVVGDGDYSINSDLQSNFKYIARDVTRIVNRIYENRFGWGVGDENEE